MPDYTSEAASTAQILERVAGASKNPEHITITTTTAAATAGNFSTYTTTEIRDVLIQNLSAFACYITWGTTAPTATANSALLTASGSISLENVAYTYFSVIRIASDDVSIRITGVGK